MREVSKVHSFEPAVPRECRLVIVSVDDPSTSHLPDPEPDDIVAFLNTNLVHRLRVYKMLAPAEYERFVAEQEAKREAALAETSDAISA